jgi:hypothetical protein
LLDHARDVLVLSQLQREGPVALRQLDHQFNQRVRRLPVLRILLEVLVE